MSYVLIGCAVLAAAAATAAWQWSRAMRARLEASGQKAEEMEERYRAVVELANAGVWITDEEGLTTSADRRLCRALGYRAGDIRGKPLSDFIVRRRRVSNGSKLVGKRGAKAIEEGELRRRDGDSVPVLVSAKRLHSGNGDGAATLTLVTEAGGHKKAEAETALLKNEFFALVSHELRTPLTSMTGYLDLVAETQRSRMDADGRGYLEVIHRNTNRLTRLLNDLMLLTQVEAGTFVIESDQTNLRDLVRSSVEEARPAAVEAGIELELKAGRKVACWGDGNRIGQVLDNLILNAIKFTDRGGRVEVRIRKHEDRALIEVEDDGPGIPAGESRYLFDRFYRASEARAKQVQGLGLGLAIVKAVVDAHGGKIELDSEPGRGTTFSVELPSKRPAPGSQRWAKTSAVRRAAVKRS